MKGLPVELLYVLAFIGIVLFNYVMQRAARHRQEEEQAPPPEQPPPAADQSLQNVWGRSPVAAPEPAPQRAPVPRPAPLVRADSTAPRQARALRLFLQDERGLRRAIVLMTVLGPCRAQEPPKP